MGAEPAVGEVSGSGAQCQRELPHPQLCFRSHTKHTLISPAVVWNINCKTKYI